MLTIRVDCERINGRYTNNAEYRGKITRRDLTLNIGPNVGGVGEGGGVRSYPSSWANNFKVTQIFTRN